MSLKLPQQKDLAFPIYYTTTAVGLRHLAWHPFTKHTPHINWGKEYSQISYCCVFLCFQFSLLPQPSLGTKPQLSNRACISYFHYHRFNTEDKSQTQMYHGCQPLQAGAAIPQSMNRWLVGSLCIRNYKISSIIYPHQGSPGLKAGLLAMSDNGKILRYHRSLFSPHHDRSVEQLRSWGSLEICGFALSSVGPEDIVGQSVLAR